MAAAEDSTTIIDEALAAKLAAVLDIQDPEQAKDLADDAARLLATRCAPTADAPPRVHPSTVLRRLENIRRRLQDRRLPTRRVLASPGVKAALDRAGVDVLAKIRRTHRKGARGAALAAIEGENFGIAERYVDEAIKHVRTLAAERRGQRGVHLGRIADVAKTKAVADAAFMFWSHKGQQPTCRGAGPLTTFERFLELLLAEWTGSNGRALARRWRRFVVAQGRCTGTSEGQNGGQRSSTAA
jgi:hypothetical protein